MNSSEIIERYHKDELKRITDNETYNTLILSQQHYYAELSERCVKIFLKGLFDVEGSDTLIFETEWTVNDNLFHAIGFNDTTTDFIYNHDFYSVSRLKEVMRSIDRISVDYGYESLEDFINKFNIARDEYPELFI